MNNNNNTVIDKRFSFVVLRRVVGGYFSTFSTVFYQDPRLDSDVTTTHIKGTPEKYNQQIHTKKFGSQS